MEKLNTKTLSAIVNQHYLAAIVFEKYQLDFCCLGNVTLENACREHHLSLQDIIAELKNIGQHKEIQLDYHQLTMTQLIDYILLTHHAYIKEVMPLIHKYLLKIATKHHTIFPELNKVFQLFIAIKKEMEIHLHKEETVMFPAFKKLEEDQQHKKKTRHSKNFVQLPIHLLEEEHSHAETFFEALKSITNHYQPPLGACTLHKFCYFILEKFDQDLGFHTHLENNILFPKACKLMGIQQSNSF